MVAAESDDSRECFAVLCWSFLVGVCSRGAGEDCIMSFFDLMECPGVIISATLESERFLSSVESSLRCDWDISTIQDCCPRIERVRR